jgi:plasmid stability protein
VLLLVLVLDRDSGAAARAAAFQAAGMAASVPPIPRGQDARAPASRDAGDPAPAAILTAPALNAWGGGRIIRAPRGGMGRSQAMPVTLSIEGVPDRLVEALRRRAAEHNRTVEEEVVGILEDTLPEDGTITPGELLAEVQAMGLRSPADSVEIIREDRDGGHRR